MAFLLHLLLGIAFAPTAWAGLLLQWLQSHVMPTLLIDPTDGTIVDANGAAKAENRNDFVFPHRLADGRVSEIHGLVHDVTKEMHLTEALERIAYHDPLTGLANRNGLVAGPSKRSHAASQKKKPSFVVLGVLDLDEFAAVNLHYGIVRKDTGSRSRCLRRKPRRGRRRARSFTKLPTSRNLHYR